MSHPRKRFFRQRAHANPLVSIEHLEVPVRPFRGRTDDAGAFDVFRHYPSADASRRVTMVDVGCGYGGLLIRLAPQFKDELLLGMEIRDKVAEYVRLRIEADRAAHRAGERPEPPSDDEGQGVQESQSAKFGDLEHDYNNVSVAQSNSMKHWTRFFAKGQLKKLFFCFPDPHFKASKVRWRIISPALLSQYAFSLAIGGMLYTITDVRDLHEWMVLHCTQHPLFERVPDADLEADPAAQTMWNATEEGQKVERTQGKKFMAVFRRVERSVPTFDLATEKVPIRPIFSYVSGKSEEHFKDKPSRIGATSAR